MDVGIIGALVAAAVACLMAFPLGDALRRYPVPFYLAALVVVGAYCWALLTGTGLAPVRVLSVVMQRGYLCFALLVLVMVVGCLDEASRLRRRLQPIRGELSILAFIFILGYVATYAPGILRRLRASAQIRDNLLASLVAAVVLLLLFAFLTLISLRSVRAKMNQRAWRRAQRLSYVMVALFAAHVWLVLGWSAFAHLGTSVACVSFALYSAVLVAYVVFRVRKALRRR